MPAVAHRALLIQDRLQSLRAGFQSHVPKPVVPEEFGGGHRQRHPPQAGR